MIVGSYRSNPCSLHTHFRWVEYDAASRRTGGEKHQTEEGYPFLCVSADVLWCACELKSSIKCVCERSSRVGQL